MSVAALTTPLSAFAESHEYTGPCLIIAWTNVEWGLHAICVNDDGNLVSIPYSQIRVDIRYDWNGHQFIDVNGVTDDAEEEPAPDGGEAVP